MEVIGIAHRNNVEVGGVDFDKRKVGGGVGSDNCGIIVAVVVERHLKTLGVGNHMVVGHDISVGRYDYARAKANLPLLRLARLLLAGLLLAGSAEEIFKERVVEESSSVAHILLLAWGGVTFYRHNAVDSAFGSVDKGLLVGGWSHGALARYQGDAHGGGKGACGKNRKISYFFHNCL